MSRRRRNRQKADRRPNRTDQQPPRGTRLKPALWAIFAALVPASLWLAWATSAPNTNLSSAREDFAEATPLSVRTASDRPSDSSGKLPKETAVCATPSVESTGRSANDWDSEVFHDAANAQLKALGKLLSPGETLDTAAIERLAAADCTCGPLRAKSLKRVFHDETVVIDRQQKIAGKEKAPLFSKGRKEFAEAIRQLRAPFGPTAAVRVKFKIFDIQLTPKEATTTVDFQAYAPTEDGSIQQNATWHCRWRRVGPKSAPLLTHLHVTGYEEVTKLPTSGPWFADCTDAVLGGNSAFTAQLMHGVDYWRERLDRRLGTDQMALQGVAVGDVNGDGLEDLYVCQQGGLPNRLFVQNADGTATDVSQAAGVDYLVPCRSALFVDLDNDADQDLVVVSNGQVMFHENDGTGRFTMRTKWSAKSKLHSIAAADYDNDGRLDIYVCGFDDKTTPVPYHDANNGAPNALLRNAGQWQFKNVTTRVGLDDNNRRFSYAAAWQDYDNDGWLDLYVANDFGRNNLYRNQDGRFVDVAAQAGVEDLGAGMSVSWGDYNNDGWVDLYVSNMFSSAGRRITTQSEFMPNTLGKLRSQYLRHARGNSLFENAGDGTFRDRSLSAGVTLGRWAWGSNFIDVNNDGLMDLVVANGYVTGKRPGDL